MKSSLWFLYRKLALISVLLMVGMAWDAKVEAANLNLSWTETSTNVNGFLVKRMAADGSFVQIASVGASVTSYTDSGLTAGVTYCYVVQAYNSAGTSDPSNGACATAKDTTSTTSTSSTTTTTSTSTSGSGTTLTLQSASSTSSTTPNTLPAVSYIGGKWKDYKVTLKMKSTDRDSIGVMFRYLDNNNYYRFSWNWQSKFRRLEKIQNGVVTVLAQDSVKYVSGKTYQLEIDAQGTTLRVLINGSLIFSVTDSSFAEGTIALYSYYNQGSIFDDIVVQDLATGAILLSENFNDGNFTGWTIIDDKGTTGGPSLWSAQSGALVQSSNIGSNTTSKLGTFALYTRGSWADYRISMKIKSLDNNALGVMFRYQDNNNYYRFSWSDDPMFRRLEKLESGVVTVLAEDAVPYVSGQSYQLQIIAQGSTLQVWIDGVLIFSVADQSFAGGTIAMYSRWNQGSIFDDILVEDLGTGTVLLWDDFNDGNMVGWTIIDDKGTEGGPSVWSAQSGALVQSSNIGSNTSGNLGTFAVY